MSEAPESQSQALAGLAWYSGLWDKHMEQKQQMREEVKGKNGGKEEE